MDDPQAASGRGRWMAHDGLIWIDEMPDEYLLNAYKTCLRFQNPKAGELLAEIEARNLDWRLI